LFLGEKMELKEALIQYRDLTIKLINIAEKEEFDSMEKSLNNREDIIDILKKLHYNTLEFTNLIKELEIMILEEKLKSIMIEKKDMIKEEIQKVAKSKNANLQYSKKDYTKPLYFNEKI